MSKTPLFLDYRVRLKVLTPLHIGSGLMNKAEADVGQELPEVAAVVYGYDQEGRRRPYIPGSSLKGVMRQAAVSLLDKASLTNLFGTAKKSRTRAQDTLGQDTPGDVMFWGGALVSDPLHIDDPIDGQTNLPALNAETHVYVHTRTAIDRGRGISDASKLFSAEQVAPNAEFDLDFRLTVKGDNQQSFEALLANLASDRGFILGGHATQGFGRVRFVGATRRPYFAGVKGALELGETTELALDALADDGWEWIGMELYCPGPFYISDPSAVNKDSIAGPAKGVLDRDDNEEQAPQSKKAIRPNPTNSDTSDEEKFQQKALRNGDAPHLIGSEIKGKLRARYAWQLATRETDEEHNPLPTVEDLFGSPNKAGCLIPWVKKVERICHMRSTSVKIDRFTGGALDGALFSADVDYGIRLSVQFQISPRARDAEQNAIKALIKDVENNGIELGQRTNSGFGWFQKWEEA